MALNVKVGLVGALDMLKFKNMAKVREEAIQAAPAREVDGNFTINTKAKSIRKRRSSTPIIRSLSSAK